LITGTKSAGVGGKSLIPKLKKYFNKKENR